MQDGTFLKPLFYFILFIFIFERRVRECRSRLADVQETQIQKKNRTFELRRNEAVKRKKKE